MPTSAIIHHMNTPNINDAMDMISDALHCDEDDRAIYISHAVLANTPDDNVPTMYVTVMRPFTYEIVVFAVTNTGMLCVADGARMP